MAKLELHLTNEEAERLERDAAALGVTPADLVRRHLAAIGVIAVDKPTNGNGATDDVRQYQTENANSESQPA